ncbi:hypothetical protein ACFQE1_03410 [Halobium palmae]|uniref:Terminase small subunit n=1 Tax=Halobium palmae TaxID=1776492 RepID=A0ABD5RW58_9EURY
MATTQDTSGTQAQEEEEFEPNLDNLVKEQAKNFLEHEGEMKRAYEIKSAIDSESIDYTRRRCNALAENDEIAREYRGRIIGHPMPPNGDEIKVLEGNRDTLLQIVDTYGTTGQYQQAKQLESVSELRKFIKKNIAIGDGHGLGTNKVFFGPLEDEE